MTWWFPLKSSRHDQVKDATNEAKLAVDRLKKSLKVKTEEQEKRIDELLSGLMPNRDEE